MELTCILAPCYNFHRLIPTPFPLNDLYPRTPNAGFVVDRFVINLVNYRSGCVTVGEVAKTNAPNTNWAGRKTHAGFNPASSQTVLYHREGSYALNNRIPVCV